MNRTQSFFLIAIGINTLYLIITFLFFYFFDSFLMNIDNNDYLSFHNAGIIVIEDLPNLYDSSIYLFPFRYFPLSAYFFTPFSLLGLKLGYFTFQIFNFVLNFINIYLIFKIVQLYKDLNTDLKINYKTNNLKEIFTKPENESILYQNAVLLIMAPQFMNYFLGQINIIVTFFILSSILFFLRAGTKNDFLGGLLLGFGILIKPTLILILIFIIPLTYQKENERILLKLKQTILRLIGTVVLLIISGIYFLAYPEMFTGFIEVNLAGKYTYNLGGDLEINPSFSLTRFVLIILDLIGLNLIDFLVFFIILLLFLVPIYLIFIHSSNQSNKLIYGYFAGIVISLIAYFDTWPHHLIVLAPFLIFFILLNKDFDQLRLIKYVHYLLSTIILGFWGIFYLTYEIFPFNIGGVVLLLILYYGVLLYFKNRFLYQIN